MAILTIHRCCLLDAHADAVLATVALESERGERNRLQMDAEQFEKVRN